jgi:voltage-gated potassium channel Kch
MSESTAPAEEKPSPATQTRLWRSSMRSAVYHWLFDQHGRHSYAQIVEKWIAILIIANIAVMLFELIPAIYEPYAKWFHVFDVFSIIIFTLEYLMRLYVAPEDPEFAKSRYPRIKYAFSIFALIDLAAILPFYLSAFVQMDLRVLRILRLLRLLKLFRVLLPAIQEFNELNRGRSLRQKIHALVFPSAYGGRLHHYYDLFIVFFVLLSVLAVILESVDSIYYHLAVEFVILDTLAVLVFCFEYAFRLYACVEEPRFQHWLGGRLRYARQPSALIDILAILPFFLEVLLHHLVDLRFLRTFRLLRLFKLTRYTGSTSTLMGVVRREMPIIAAAAFTMMLLVILAASFGYLFEHEAQPDKFENIPTAIYWAVITLASVGYGDISPITPMGRFMTMIMALLGIGIFAIPASILSSAFMQELQSQRQQLENQLNAMLADGVLSDEEMEDVRALAKRLNMSPHQLDILIEKTKLEHAERAKNNFFMPKEFLSDHPEIAAAQFHILAEQIKRLASLPNGAAISAIIARSQELDEVQKRLWHELHEKTIAADKPNS